MILAKIPHQLYYVVELFVLLAGFFTIYAFSFDYFLQLLILTMVLAAYSTLGLIHHKVHHSIKKKIVIEYILISSLIFVAFIFLNIGNL